MAEPFDSYHKWLGIAPKDQPPHHYRLLGIELFEADPEVIDAAANRVAAYLEGCNQGAHLPQLQRLLEEVATARLCLLDEGRKAQYDAQLESSLQAGSLKAELQRAPRVQRPARPSPQSPAPAADDSPLALNFAASPAPAKSSPPPEQPGKRAKRQVKARSWKEYLIWLSPALVLLVAAMIYLKTRSPKPPVVIQQQQQRPAFNSEEDAKAGVEPVRVESLGVGALDDNAAVLRGDWLATQDLRDKYVGRYYQVAKSGDHVARFPVTVSGTFEVRMSYVPAPQRATNVKVQIFPADGKPVTITVNQRQPPAIDGLFHSLGTFNFQGGDDERIEISAQGADGSVVADAVQFIRAVGKK